MSDAILSPDEFANRLRGMVLGALTGDRRHEADDSRIIHAHDAALRAEVERLTDENALLRSPHDAYTEAGEPVLPRGWTPIDGGRLDELEAAEARVAALTALLRKLVDAHDDETPFGGVREAGAFEDARAVLGGS